MTPQRKKNAARRFELLLLADYDEPLFVHDAEDERHMRALSRRKLVEKHPLSKLWRRTLAGDSFLRGLA